MGYEGMGHVAWAIRHSVGMHLDMCIESASAEVSAATWSAVGTELRLIQIWIQMLRPGSFQH